MVNKYILEFIWLCLFSSYSLVWTKSLSSNLKLAIDHDGGADDAMAILLATSFQKNFNGPEIVALLTVHGNVNESQAFANTQRILNVADRYDIPIYRGAQEALVIDEPTDAYFGKDGLGDSENVVYRSIEANPLQAALALIQLSHKYRDELIVVALGPLTNIALAIKMDPGIIGRINQLYIGAGHIYDEDLATTAKPEFNVFLDVEAYHIVAKHAVPTKVTAVPFSQVIKSCPIPQTWRTETLGKLPTRTIKALNSFEQVNLSKGISLWQLLDPAVMTIALDNSIIFDLRSTENNVILCAEGPGQKQRGITLNRFDSIGNNMMLVYAVNMDMLQNFLLKVFSE